MKMLIPVCGDVIKIAKDVEVELKNIAQNTNFLEKYDEKLKNVKQINKKKHFITLKKGTLLTIDRVYIRQGDSAKYNSITFKINKDKNLPNGRFFLPVSVVNTLDIEFLGQESEKSMALSKWLLKNYKELDSNSIIKEKIDSKLKFSMNIDLVKSYELLNNEINKILSKSGDNLESLYKKCYKKTKGEEKAILKEWYTSLPELRKSIIKLNNIEYANFNFLEVNESTLKENNFIKYEVLENDILKLLSNFINNVSWMNNYEYREFGYDFILRFSRNNKLSKFENIFNYNLEELYSNYNISYETKNILRKNLIEYKKISDMTFLNPNKIDWMNEMLIYKINDKVVSLKELRKALTKAKK
tara:strand:- start:3146 stop:4219 length:1074 start_codon:yes stop_codon:yes gene_type:complete